MKHFQTKNDARRVKDVRNPPHLTLFLSLFLRYENREEIVQVTKTDVGAERKKNFQVGPRRLKMTTSKRLFSDGSSGDKTKETSFPPLPLLQGAIN